MPGLRPWAGTPGTASGLRELGYRYVVIDDCWSLRERGSHGKLVPDPAKFPGGMKALADTVHAQGLKLGIYSDAAELTCAGHPGSLGFEEQAAAVQRYTRMAEALRQTGRDILFNICEWGGRNPHLWARQAGGHAWRVTPDVLDSWTDIWVPQHNWTGYGIDSAIEASASLHGFAGPAPR